MNPRTVADGASLLETWCDALIAHQVGSGDDHGGLLCPGCGFVHGRCGDAIYPLMAQYARSRNEKYRRAAIEVYDWSERHVSPGDGSWLNEAYPTAWKGITCFSTLALGETLRHYGELLESETLARWRERLRGGGDFLLDYIQFETGDINYPISTAAALALTWRLLGDDKYRRRAHELAYFGLKHFTASGLLWGEGQRGADDLTPRGLRPIDVPYNVEESLPNLALYAHLTGDETVRAAVVASLRAHLPFLLPDGGWDCGWCSRQYKWTYWGSRTTDGSASGFTLLQSHDARFATAAALNVQLLQRCTHDGLLHGGLHLHERGIAPCIHHTFSHAKGLAVALDSGWDGDGGAPLDIATNGVHEWPEALVSQVVQGAWRASLTANDLPHTTKRAGYPSGGSLSLLWHEKTGPVCVASMNEYVRYESTNMQTPANDDEQFVLTPRLELRRDDQLFSSVYDGTATLEWKRDDDEIEITARGALKNCEGEAAIDGEYTLVYRFKNEAFEVNAVCGATGTRFVLPVVSPQSEPVHYGEAGLTIDKPGATVRVSSSEGTMKTSATGRVFNFVPGVEALPLLFDVAAEQPLSVQIAIE